MPNTIDEQEAITQYTEVIDEIGAMLIKPKLKLYCAKNLIYELTTGERFCDGPNGNGVEDSCVGCNAFPKGAELETAIGEYVTRKMGV